MIEPALASRRHRRQTKRLSAAENDTCGLEAHSHTRTCGTTCNIEARAIADRPDHLAHQWRRLGPLAWHRSSVRLGLDLQAAVTWCRSPSSKEQITDEQLAQTVEIIRARVDGLGVAEAEVTAQGSGNSAAIVVSVQVWDKTGSSSLSSAPPC